ncbi:MAG: hypothetical protein HY700_01110, partial [Gemmatimonadetes bacterium]|nr:hypothetical protein [Gemmatimonadota bacterium]
LTGLPVGSYTVNVYWYKTNEVTYYNRLTGITVSANSTTPANVTTPTTFVPTLTALTSPTWMFRVNATFNTVAAADSYKVEYANNSGFTGATTVTPWPKTGTAALAFNATGTWYWRVRSANAQAPAGGQASASSSVTVNTDMRASGDVASPTSLGFFATTTTTLDSLNIFPAGDDDWFAVSQCNGDTLTVNVQAARLSPASPLNSAVQVYNNSGLLVAQNDDSSATNTDGFVKIGQSYDNAYRVRVSAGGNGSSIGHYKLQVAGKAGPNNQTSSCRVVPLAATQVSGGLYHTCVVRSITGSNVDCWGNNGNGQLGNGTSGTATSSPVRVSGSTTFAQVVTGAFHTCARTSAGAAYCWGSNFQSQIGDGTGTDRSVPTPVGGGIVFASLASGYNYTCGLTSAGAAYCWGSNAFGQFGNGSTSNASTPTQVPFPFRVTAFSSIGAGQFHACFAATDGYMYCAGDNTYGQLGTGDYTSSSSLMSSGGPAPGGVWVQAEAGNYHTCGRANTNLVYCWGDNAFGELGDGTFTSNTGPGSSVGGISFSTIDAGRVFTCGLSGSTIYCWGSNRYAQLGDGTMSNQSSPVAVPGAYVSVTSGSYHTCAVASSGSTTYCWGWNTLGAIGDASPFNHAGPVPVSGGFIWKSLSPGNLHTCGVTTTNASYCWGYNGAGQLGDGTSTTRVTPQPVSVGVVTFTYIGTGRTHSCGLTTGSQAYCWGANQYGQLGDGSTAPRPTPSTPVNTGQFFTQISVGDEHACGRTSANQIYCWGYGLNGQLGNGGTGNNLSPSPISSAVSFASVAAGGLMTCGLTSTGTGYCWGDNTYGGLGTGSTSASPSLTPVQMSGGQTWATVTPGFDFGCGRTTANAGFCWGHNLSGQLGIGNSTTTATITAITGSLTWSSIQTSRNEGTCAVTTANIGYCWGYGFYGQIGDGGFANRTSPTPINTAVPFSVVQPGDLHTCAIATNNSGFCWGNNEYGQAGNGTRTVRLAPTQVITGPAAAPQVLVSGVIADESVDVWGRPRNRGRSAKSDQPTP